MASRALNNILEGIFSGAASSLQRRRAQRAEDQEYRKRRQRRMDEMKVDQQMKSQAEDQMFREREARKKTMQEDIYNRMLKRYPDRAQNPEWAAELRSKIEGINVPDLPTSPEIADMTAQGKFMEAWSRAKTDRDKKHVLDSFRIAKVMRPEMFPDKATYKSGDSIYQVDRNNLEKGVTGSVRLPKTGGTSSGSGATPNQQRLAMKDRAAALKKIWDAYEKDVARLEELGAADSILFRARMKAQQAKKQWLAFQESFAGVGKGGGGKKAASTSNKSWLDTLLDQLNKL